MNLFKTNNKGMSLIEVIVAMGVMGILSYAMIEMISNQNKAIKTTQYAIDVNEVQNQLQRYMLDSAICKSTLSGITLTPGGPEATVQNIKNNTTVLLDTVAPNNKIGGIEIQSLKIKRLAAPNDKELELVASLKKSISGVSYAGDNFTRTIKLSAKFRTVAPLNQIDSCYSQMDNAVNTAVQQACLQLCPTCTWDSVNNVCVRPPSAASKPVYYNPITGQLQLTVPPSYHDVAVHCSRCGGNCTPGCPGGYGLISNNCRMTGQCGFRRWRDCDGVCRKNFPPFTPEGYLTPNPN